jgi:hypothetical protein
LRVWWLDLVRGSWSMEVLFVVAQRLQSDIVG